MHLGFVVVILVVIGACFLLWRTSIGFRLRSVGHSREVANYAGMSVRKNIVSALAISGAMSGIAGIILVFGSESHRMVNDGSSTGF